MAKSFKIGEFFYSSRELAPLNVNRNIRPINKVLTGTLKELGIYDKILQAKIEKHWQDFVGKTAAKYTLDLQLINNRLYVKIEAAALRQELSLRRSQILKALNDALGSDIEEIILY